MNLNAVQNAEFLLKLNLELNLKPNLELNLKLNLEPNNCVATRITFSLKGSLIARHTFSTKCTFSTMCTFSA